MAPLNDPFLWGVDQVVDALCAVGKPWVQDAGVLESRIREEEIDGNTLLTWEDVLPSTELLDLLGIKIARRRLSLAKELRSLRSPKRSPAYHASLNEGSEASQSAAERSNFVGVKQSHPSTTSAAELYPNGVSNGLHYEPTVDEAGTSDQNENVEHAGFGGATVSVSLPSSGIADQLQTSIRSEQSAAAEETRKRKRVNPTYVSEETRQYVWEKAPDSAYIGEGCIPGEDIMDFSALTSTWLVDDADDDSFVYLSRNRLPPGRRRAVNSTLQRFLRTGSGAITAPGFGQQPADDETASSVGISSAAEAEEDRQIADEMEDERQEVETYMKQNPFLTQERIQALIEDEIARMTMEWKERKTSMLERKAYSIWAASWRRRSKGRDLVRARKEVQALNDRLQRLSTEMLTINYEGESELRHSIWSLQATVEDKLYQSWLADTLELCTAPPRPETLPRPERPIRKPRVHDPELISSSDEDDFVVDDEDDLMNDPVGSESRVSGDEPMGLEDAFAQHPPPEEVEDPKTPIDVTPHQGPDDEQEITDIGQGAAVVKDPKANTPELSLTTVAVKNERVGASNGRQSELQQQKTPPEVIDLTTPTKSTSFSQKKSRAPVDIPDNAPWDALGAENVDEIGKAGFQHWFGNGDRHRLVICMLKGLDFESRSEIFKTLDANPPEEVWKKSVLTFLNDESGVHYDDLETAQGKADFDITRLFLSFIRTRNQPRSRLAPPSARSRDKLQDNAEHFPIFCRFVTGVEQLFPDESQIYYRPEMSDNEFEDDILEVEYEEDLEEAGESQRSRARGRKGNPKEIVRNKDAVGLRLKEQERIRDQEARARKLRQTLDESKSISQDKSRLIINESKDAEQSLIYVNEEIGKTIKNHQIEGVRFFWNQIIEPDPANRQGCLLSHTMGLGKTMQVITFLVAVAQASSDPSLRSQIPEDLRNSQTLIICPPGLVNNWMDELLKWAPKDSLGQLLQVDALNHPEERLDIVETWADRGGVLVMGYALFLKLTKADSNGEDSSEQKDERTVTIAERLLGEPNIVVADEAHEMKNLKGQLNHGCHRLSSSTRLALTGSPLSNHVREYYAMIDWVAPNFLGPYKEFKEIYVHDIERGLQKESDSFDKRQASKTLQVLKETVDPKVNRATTKTPSVGSDLPSKAEFMISVPPTPLQRKLYELFIDNLSKASLVSLIYDLGLICAHPRCFRWKAQEVKKADRSPKRRVRKGGIEGNDDKYKSFPRAIIDEVLRLTADSNPLDSNKIRLLTAILDEARQVGDKVLVFSHSLETLNFLENLLKIDQKRKVCRLDGSSKVSDRQDMTKRFNTGDREIYLISTRAGGVGLNIHGANRVVLFDTKWNPVHDQQAVGRAYRLGQKKPVSVYYLKVAGSFEEIVQDQAIFKTQLASRVVDKTNPVAWGKRHGQYGGHLKPFKRMDLSTFENKDRILDRLIKEPPAEDRITKILFTDTLEEEDPTSALTKEERAEATRLVRLHELKRSDPDRYAIEKAEIDKEQVRRQAQGTPVGHPVPSRWPQTSVTLPQQPPRAATNNGTGPPPSQGSSAAPNIPGLHNYRAEPTQLASSLPVEPSVMGSQATVDDPRHCVAHEPPPQTPCVPHDDQATTDAGLQPSNGSAPRLSTNSSTAPGPVVGANTFFGRPRVSSTPTQSLTRTRDASITPSRRGNLFQQPIVPQKKHFEDSIHRKVTELLQPNIGPEAGKHCAQSIITGVQGELLRKDRGFLPDNQQWKTLTEMLEHERFALATMAQTISPKFLANATKQQLTDRLQAMNDLSYEEFRGRLSKNGDAEELTARGASHSDRAARLAADQNARARKPRLPSWAVNTIASGSDKDSNASKDDDKGLRAPQPYA